MDTRQAQYIRRRRTAVIDLTEDDIRMPPMQAVTDAVNAAAWETEGRYITGTDGEMNGFRFFTEAVAVKLSEYGRYIDPAWVKVNNGDRAAFPTLFETLPRDTRIAIPLPGRTDVISAIKKYYDKAYFFEPSELMKVPMPRDLKGTVPEVIFLSSPCEPSGAAFSKSEISEWTDYAKEVGAFILWDSSLCGFCEISEPVPPKEMRRCPGSVYSVGGAVGNAVELRSFCPSVSAGISCGYSVIPDSVMFRGEALSTLIKCAATRRDGVTDPLCGGVSYSLQRGAAAVLGSEGIKECKERVGLFLRNTLRLSAALSAIGFDCPRSGTSPYVFAALPNDMFFSCDLDACDYLEYRIGIRALPGSLFGITSGNFLRFSGMCPPSAVDDAVSRLLDL